MSNSPALIVDETSARQVLLLRAFEAEDAPPWTMADREWATRVARASLGDGASPGQVIVERAQHAMQRLAARDPGVRALLTARFAFRAWTLVALMVGLGLGALVDQIGPTQRINLLAPPVWLLVGWNLLAYALLAGQRLMPAAARRGLHRRLQALWTPRSGKSSPLLRFGADWAAFSAPLNSARAAWLLHLAAAALALGVVGGLYLRGLVLDYRAGWESTFLDTEVVHRVLQTLLAPASAVTGVAVPGAAELAAQRVNVGLAPGASAGPWLHLYAATLALFVIGPRLLLALLALVQLLHGRSRATLPLQDGYFQRLLQQVGGGQASVWLLPHAAPLSGPAALALQAQLLAAAGPGVQLRVADPVGLGNEDDAARCTPPAGSTLALVQVDLASTPEAEAQGRLLSTLASVAGGCPCGLLVDETAFVSRFAQLPQRLHERRQAWQQLAERQGMPWIGVDLAPAQPMPDAIAAWRRLLGA